MGHFNITQMENPKELDGANLSNIHNQYCQKITIRAESVKHPKHNGLKCSSLKKYN